MGKQRNPSLILLVIARSDLSAVARTIEAKQSISQEKKVDCFVAPRPRNDARTAAKRPDGQTHFRMSEFVSSPQIQKIFRFIRRPNQWFILPIPPLLRRASAVVTDVGRGAMDAGLR
jgi:hypothetical protein